MTRSRDGARRAVEFFLSFGEYEGESELASGRRRVVIGAVWVSLPAIALSSIAKIPAAPLVASVLMGQVIVHSGALTLLRIRPRRIVLILGIAFTYDVLIEVVISYLYGGLVLSGATTIWSIIGVLAAMLVFGTRAARWWFLFFAGSILAAAMMATRVEPTYVIGNTDGELASNLIGATFLSFLVMAYFVRQRDRFQMRSDELLHNILPAAIAARLKDDETMIADDMPEVSVLFADIVEFTPMSVDLSASELIGLLNAVFTKLDQLVDELGLEKIKTVGDEYMVAAGVPNPSSDHAHSIAALALNIRDALASSQFDGHEIEMRIGIDSGPVVAGVIGQKKFAYDLWGETVNTASRMESTGVAGAIQITSATYERIKGTFLCEHRGEVDVKGLGRMDTYFLIDQRERPRWRGGIGCAHDRR